MNRKCNHLTSCLRHSQSKNGVSKREFAPGCFYIFNKTPKTDHLLYWRDDDKVKHEGKRGEQTRACFPFVSSAANTTHTDALSRKSSNNWVTGWSETPGVRALDKMLITLKTLQQQTFKVDIDEEETVRKRKLCIHKVCGGREFCHRDNGRNSWQLASLLTAATWNER